MKIELPIDEVLTDIVDSIRQSGSVIVVAEPGAGKTTRVPPAFLNMIEPDKQIILLQPRRVAARAAAARISEEQGTIIGEKIGYQVRHESRSRAETKILVCTEGVFLRKLQEDPMLANVGIVIFDEFHERSLDSDLALALVRQIKSDLRPDLKIVVMSATLDASAVSCYLNECPIIQSKGRNYPVEMEYFPVKKTDRIEQSVSEGIKKMLAKTSGHILAFLPGVREIHATRDLLENSLQDTLLLPLYGEMPLEDQHRVLTESSKRKVVLATNVAETSITINGVTAVVDSGMARVNRLDPRLGLNSLNLERISRASADQRSGRAGRTQGGNCLRLWSEREQQSMEAFNSPEIERVELSECVLQLLAWGEKNVAAFPWFSPPPQNNLTRAIELLDWLDATEDGNLTDDGRQMSCLPLQPRLARLMLEGARLGQTRNAAICAALLSRRDIIKKERDLEKQGAVHRSESDVLDRVFLINQFEEKGLRHSYAGEVSARQAKQIIQDAEQLVRLIKPIEKKLQSTDTKQISEDEALMRALLTAYCDRLCRRREKGKNTALMVGGRGVRLADESAVADAELFLAIELMETGKSESMVRQASAVKKEWLPKSHFSTSVEVEFDSQRSKVVAFKRTRFLDLVIEENITALSSDIDTGGALAQGLLQQGIDIGALVDEETRQYLARIKCLQDSMPELDLPQLSSEPWLEFLPEWCSELTSLDELKSRSLLPIIQGALTYEQTVAIDREAPARMEIPSGSQIKLIYEIDKPPVLAARIQELFGMIETPRIANSRVPVLVHLLAPNFRVQQITPDLGSFWRNTYSQVRKDLKALYPKHSWPEDPLTAKAERGPKRKP